MRRDIGRAALCVALGLFGCTGSGVGGPDPLAPSQPDGGAGGVGGQPAPGGAGGTGGAGAQGGAGGGGGAPPVTPEGVALYGEQCAGCHGPAGLGSDAGPPLDQLADRGRAWLVDRIERTMPSGQPERCQGVCAEAVADFVLGRLQTAPPVDCSDAPWPPRRLRLLNPREYRATVQDVFFPDQGAGEAACPPHTFTWDSAGRAASTVHVAGDFNGWAGTVAGGGWPMAQAGGRWSLTRALPPGRHAYKFVIDEQDWIADPSNPLGEDDGFGGRNSVVEVPACGADAGPDLGRLLAGLVPAVRPEHFGFDTHAGSGRAGAVHVDAWLDAAEGVAQAALASPQPWLGCASVDACPERLVDEVAPRLFRRALTADERARWLGVARSDGRAALEGLLSSPGFLYRVELGAGDGPFTLTGPETATAMSYFLWGTGPDAALRDAAEAGRLATAEGRAAEARRMLGDPRARRQIGTFAAQWLGVDSVQTLVKAPELYPAFDEALARDFLAETQAFAAAVVFDGAGTFTELVTADWTVASPRLAAHYELGAPGADGRVTLSRGRRAGVLGQAGVLATQAHSDQSSPIRRGLWVRGHLLCQPLPPAPPNAGGVPDVDPNATTRERFRQHTDDPFCAGCHQYIDELGFGFEHFDAVGAWRETENGAPIDARSNLNDLEGLGVGTDAPYVGLPELGALLADSEAAPRCFVSQLWQFALGRAADGAADACHVDQLADGFVAGGGDIRALLVALVAHPAFVTRGPEGER